jgi:hypothetical protein
LQINGTEVHPSIEFEFNIIYDTQQPINGIDGMVTKQEIKDAIKTWPPNKAAGPDDFAGEFYQSFVEILLPDIK